MSQPGQPLDSRAPAIPPVATPPEEVPPRPGRLAAVLANVPFAFVPAVAVMALALVLALRPILDIDLYWHLVVGDELRSGVPISQAGQGWSFAPVPDTWVSSQWLAEMTLSWLNTLGGFPALVLYRVLTALAALAVTAWVTLRGRPLRAAVIPFALAATALGSTSQERSQQLTYLLAPLVGWWAERLLREGRLPRWWIVLPLTVLWANYHGGWVLLPAVLCLTAVARWVTRGVRDRPAWSAVLLSAATFLAAMVSPLGPANSLTALAFSRAASSQIAEWGRVALWSDQGWQLGVILLLAVLAWCFGRTRIRKSDAGEVVLVLGMVTFGFLAYRNITPTVLVLAPLLAGVLARALPAPAHQGRAMLGRTAWAMAFAGVVAGVVLCFVPVRDLHPKVPVELYARIGAHPGTMRVLDTYNVAGPLLWYAGGPGQVQLAIDGRTDRYGAPYIDRYLDTLLAARPGWAAMLAELRPDVAVLYSGEALTGALAAKRWRTVAQERGVVLMVPPDAHDW